MAAKIKIERGESVRTAPVVARIAMADLAAKLGIPPNAKAVIVTCNGAVDLGPDDTLVAEWTETKAVRTRAKKEA